MRFPKSVFYFVAILFCLSATQLAFAAGQTISMTILGKQGKTKEIPIVSLNLGVQTARDPQSGLPTGQRQRDSASGLPTGKRQHAPIRVTKEWDASSAELHRALTTNESLQEVVFKFTRNAGGKEELYHTIKLTNAHIIHIERKGKGKTDARELEEISFAYEEIQESNGPGKTAADGRATK